MLGVSEVDDIRRTLALYSRFNDEKDSTCWSQLWTENGAITDRSGTYVGHAAIKRFLDGLVENNPHRDTLHFCANPLISIDGDTARAHTDILAVARSTNPVGPWVLGQVNHYTHRLVRSGSQWLFEERRIDRRPLIHSSLAELQLGPPADDHDAILRTLALYAQLLDNKDFTGWGEQFALNGTFHTANGDHTGRPAIKQHVEREYANKPTDYHTAHFGANAAITQDADSAQVTGDCLTLESVGEQPWSVLRVSRTGDRLVREDRGWRLTWKEE